MRCAIVFRPHTSNRDFPSRLFAKWVVGIRFRWVGKDTLFNNPLRSLFIRWDGIPVNRRERTGFIEQMRHAFEDSEDFRLVVAPEGTRRRTAHWKSGFHRRAEAAAVPVELGFTDTKPREIGIGGFVDLGGDPDADLEAIAAFHSDTHGRRSQNARPVRLP